MGVERLGRYHEPAIEELLESEPEVNLFLLGFLEVHPVDAACWLGVTDGELVRAVVLLVPGRLAVPYATDPEDAARIGRFLRARYAPTMLVGPRAASDALWREWATDAVVPDRFYDQRLYVCRRGSQPVPPGAPLPGFRRARLEEAEEIARNSGLMEEEDLGRNPQHLEPELHTRVVRDRIQAGRTWVIEREGEIVFQINVGTSTTVGCQVGGTWVPPRHRGKGIAIAGMRELCRRLLASHPIVTLHVNEANAPAVRVYERAGFERAAPFRLVTLKG